MKLVSMAVKGFRSFVEEEVFQFPEGPGLYFMLGVNEVEPRLGGNGAGKSTIWEAFTWCLQGKTSRGLKAGDVAPWDDPKGTRVSLNFLQDDVVDCLWTVTRTWSPNSWTLSHVADFITDEEVVDLVKDPTNPVLAEILLDFEPFLQSVFLAQSPRPMFLDLTGPAQASLFSSVLGLDQWSERSKRATAKASEQDRVVRALEEQAYRLEGAVKSLGEQRHGASLEEWDRKQRQRIATAEEELEIELEKRRDEYKALKEATSLHETARLLLAECQVNAGLQKDHNRLRADVSDYAMMAAEEEGKLQRMQEHYGHVDDTGVCPLCKKGMSRDEKTQELRRMERDIHKAKEKVKTMRGELEASRRRFAVVDEELRKEEEANVVAVRLLEEESRRVSQARRTLELRDRDLDRLEDRLFELEKERNPYERLEEDARRSEEKLRMELRDKLAELDAATDYYGLLSYWSKGFKEIRLREIAEALTELEVEVNSAVAELGLVGWELRFAVDKETKGGNVQQGFSVLVKAPYNERATPWAAWSGGEAQRLRLAANMGLAELIRGRTGTTLNIEVWDEPTNGLSPEGLRDLLDSLKARAIREQRQVWLLDHKAHDFGGFDGVATVTKTAKGSRVDCSWV